MVQPNHNHILSLLSWTELVHILTALLINRMQKGWISKTVTFPLENHILPFTSCWNIFTFRKQIWKLRVLWHFFPKVFGQFYASIWIFPNQEFLKRQNNPSVAVEFCKKSSVCAQDSLKVTFLSLKTGLQSIKGHTSPKWVWQTM